MNPQPTGKARGLAGFVACIVLPKGKAASSSLHIPNPKGLTVSEHSCLMLSLRHSLTQ